MKRIVYVYLGFFAALAIILVLAFNGGDNPQPEATEPAGVPQSKDGLPQVIKPVPLKKSYNFAGEPLPLDNFDVRERLARELTVNSYYHSSTTENLKKMVRYFPVIESILRANGLPDDLKYLAVAESNLSNATSPAGAKGFWQFMAPSARQYGLQVTREVDERYHLEKSTQAACQYFQDLYKRFGSWTMAAAAYNSGPTRFSKEKNLQRMDNYYDMNLNVETGRYIFRIVAIKEVMKNPEDFGFYINGEAAYPPLKAFRTLEINQAIENLGDFAIEQGISYRMLKLYNPWLISHQLSNPARKTYRIRIPTD
jgi:hypothetical protein